MEFIILGIALLSTLLWVNILFAEHITAKINPYVTEADVVQKQRAVIKTILVIIMSVFWATYIYLYR
jgi:hypothetical protein